ncbi:hypothetical protein [Virgibacillus halodenitrificans]|uniref:hypothetical protein n=1 Tax=Virgibacillus halodenitrificans TaxID=1482 RepID=UPI000B20CFDA
MAVIRRMIGQIMDTETTFPIIGVVVELINTNETIVDSAITDEKELFRLEDVSGVFNDDSRTQFSIYCH